MYPILFTIPWLDLPVTTFGVMMALGFLAAYAITAKAMAEDGLDVEVAPNLLIWIMLGGVFGSKLYYAIDVSIREGYPFFELLLDRAGMTWYGGLMGGALMGIIGAKVNKVPVGTFAKNVAPALAVGQSFGRIGCFLVGDDYGKVTDVPWGVAFPKGAPPTLEPVHPTQLYEVAWLLPVAAVLWVRRNKSPWLIGEYLMANGLGRLVIEHWRVNERVALGLTEPQWIGILLFVAGLSGWIYQWRKKADGAEAAASA
jgi:phosphatidylglycerol:prolipoprotein diacylglycerol transferase